MSGDGREGTTLASEEIAELRAAGKFATLSFSASIPDWLDRCEQQVRSPAVRHFVHQLSRFIRAEFDSSFRKGLDPMTDAIIVHCRKSDESMRMAARLFNAFAPLRATVTEEYTSGLIRGLASALGSEWTVRRAEPDNGPLRSDELVVVEKAAWSGEWWIALGQYDKDRPTECIYYCVRQAPRSELAETIKSIIDSEFRGGKKTAWSIWTSRIATGLEDAIAYLACKESVSESIDAMKRLALIVERALAAKNKSCP